MVRTIVSIDPTKCAEDQPTLGQVHNRWHPDIPAIATVAQNETFRVECFDCTGGEVGNNDDARDVLESNTGRVHHLSGPIAVEGAEPGDALEVDILDVQPLPGVEWGYTGICQDFPGGLLPDKFPKAAKVIWDFDGIYASSRHIPGVKFAGIPHPGIVGTAPSKEVLQEWNEREKDLVTRPKCCGAAVAFLPNAEGALVGKLEGTQLGEKVKTEGAITFPPRENGGNMDIKNLSRGSKIWLPVYVPGANLSVGDIHFSQGDGEITLFGAIEMFGALTLRVRVIKNGIKKLSLKNPIIIPGPVEPHYSKYLTFQGISVTEDGKQHYMDTNLAFRNACLNCIEYLSKFGYTREQLYTLISACPCEGRISAIVDEPNTCCTFAIPTEIFDFDITPKAEEIVKVDRGNVAFVKPK